MEKKPFPNGLADELFERGNIEMTSQEVRAVAISTMKVLPDSIVYDIRNIGA